MTPTQPTAPDRSDRPAKMRAAVCTAYGPPDVVQVSQVPLPRIGDRDVLVHIAATTVASADWRIRASEFPTGFKTVSRLMFGVSRPRQPILGTELSGTIVEVGPSVTRFSIGEAVIGYPGAGLACHAEYRAIREDGPLVRKPAALDFAESAALSFGGTTALHFLRDRGLIRKGHRVLVIGASGAVGTAAVQLARHFGALVTGVCSAANRELVTGLGAHDVIDYAVDDFTRGNARYDLIIDTIGVETFARARRALAPDGRFLMVAADLPQMLRALPTRFQRQRAIPSLTPERAQDMQTLVDLAVAGDYRPVIDAVFPLDRIADAHRRVESRHKRGNVVVTL